MLFETVYIGMNFFRIVLNAGGIGKIELIIFCYDFFNFKT